MTKYVRVETKKASGDFKRNYDRTKAKRAKEAKVAPKAPTNNSYNDSRNTFNDTTNTYA